MVEVDLMCEERLMGVWWVFMVRLEEHIKSGIRLNTLRILLVSLRIPLSTPPFSSIFLAQASRGLVHAGYPSQNGTTKHQAGILINIPATTSYQDGAHTLPMSTCAVFISVRITQPREGKRVVAMIGRSLHVSVPAHRCLHFELVESHAYA